MAENVMVVDADANKWNRWMVAQDFVELGCVVAEASGVDNIEQAITNPKNHPDIIVVFDDSIEIANIVRALSEQYQNSYIIAISSDGYKNSCLSNGASAFYKKSDVFKDWAEKAYSRYQKRGEEHGVEKAGDRAKAQGF